MGVGIVANYHAYIHMIKLAIIEAETNTTCIKAAQF